MTQKSLLKSIEYTKMIAKIRLKYRLFSINWELDTLTSVVSMSGNRLSVKQRHLCEKDHYKDDRHSEAGKFGMFITSALPF